MQSAIVTGGLGFIGSHLVELLVRNGIEVAVIDNLCTGTRKNLPPGVDEAVSVVEIDVSEPWPAHRIPKCVDVVFHLASPASPRQYRRLSVATLMANSYGTKNALDWAKQSGARFVFASTSEVYGDPQVTPQSESYWGHVNPVGPRSCYDESKRFGESLTMEYVRQFDLDARIVRLFNCYGPRMQADDGRVIPTFVAQVLANAPLTIYGTGTQTRSFCYVTDEILAIFRAAEVPGLAGEIINVGNPNPLTIAQLAELICSIAGRPVGFEFRTLPPDDPTNRCPDIDKARRLLSWEPVVSIEDGLSATLQYFSGTIARNPRD